MASAAASTIQSKTGNFDSIYTDFWAKGFDAQFSTMDIASTKEAITMKISVHVCVCVRVLIKSVPSITCMLLGDNTCGGMVMLQHVKEVCKVQ